MKSQRELKKQAYRHKSLDKFTKHTKNDWFGLAKTFICVSSSTFPLLEWQEREREQNAEFQTFNDPTQLINWVVPFFAPAFSSKRCCYVILIVLSNYGIEFAFTLNFRINSESNRIESVSFHWCNGIVRLFLCASLSISARSRADEKRNVLKYFRNWLKIRNNSKAGISQNKKRYKGMAAVTTRWSMRSFSEGRRNKRKRSPFRVTTAHNTQWC